MPKDPVPDKILLGHYKVGPEIGKGSFAHVYKGTDTRTNKTVAIKAVVKSRLNGNQKLIDNLQAEIQILQNLKNPHTVTLLDSTNSKDYFYLFMDFCSLGDLHFFIRPKNQLTGSHPLLKSIFERYPPPKNSHGLNEIIIINFTKQLASALKFLRSQNLIHRDLKPQNILLAQPVNSKEEFIKKGYVGLIDLPIIKIADFGFARILPSTSMAETLCGSPLYMAPEILRYEKYNAKADLWSIGAIIYEMIVGKPPFSASNHMELVKKIQKTKDKINFPSNFEINQDLIRLVCALLKLNPTERMGFKEFFNDPIITSNNLNISTINEPLDCSKLDEKMFISEYLPSKPLKDLKSIRNDNLDDLNEVVEDDDDQDVDDDDHDDDSNNSSNTGKNNTKLLQQQRGIKQPASIRPQLHQLQTTPLKKSNVEINSNNIKQPNSSNDLLLLNNNTSPSTTSPLTTTTLKIASNTTRLNKQQQKHQQQQQQQQNKYDLVFDKEYVVVEKNAVEINTLADELENAGISTNNNTTNTNTNNKINNRTKYSSSPNNESPPSNNNQLLSYNSGNTTGTTTNTGQVNRRYSSSNSKPSSLNSRRTSFGDRKFPGMSISPTTKLSKVIDFTSNKLFGTPSPNNNINNINNNNNNNIQLNDSSNVSYPRNNNTHSNNNTNNLIERTTLHLKQNIINVPTKDLKHLTNNNNNNNNNQSSSSQSFNNSDLKQIKKLETLATTAHAISLFAEVKFSQLIPLPPSSPMGLTNNTGGSSSNRMLDNTNDFGYTTQENNSYSNEAIMDDDDFEDDSSNLPPLMIVQIATEGVQLYVCTLTLLARAMDIAKDWWSRNQSTRKAPKNLYELVEWTRTTYNECLEKTEYMQLRLDEANEKLKIDQISQQQEEEPIVAEKLIFDRALEMSKQAAYNELKNQDLIGCESNYATAIWMLESLIDIGINPNNSDDQMNDDDDDSKSYSSSLDENDKKMVELFINSISKRLSILREKISNQNITH
ncbi:hypothetical protein B5S32_g3879 [[Candida] boidinii]|nr:hypothetical protein B5S32_g3879 [[Candida] boidinii]